MSTFVYIYPQLVWHYTCLPIWILDVFFNVQISLMNRSHTVHFQFFSLLLSHNWQVSNIWASCFENATVIFLWSTSQIFCFIFSLFLYFLRSWTKGKQWLHIWFICNCFVCLWMMVSSGVKYLLSSISEKYIYHYW